MNFVLSFQLHMWMQLKHTILMQEAPIPSNYICRRFRRNSNIQNVTVRFKSEWFEKSRKPSPGTIFAAKQRKRKRANQGLDRLLFLFFVIIYDHRDPPHTAPPTAERGSS